jgi:L-alanine-DL-glutamate epimerase-like enolase superfamily enzyme
VLPVWHLVGALDPIEDSELDGNEPKDDYPLVLADWIRRDGLVCLKVKLRGNDAEWDYNRLLRVGRLGRTHRVRALTVDFNGTVHDPEYVNDILDRLNRDEAELYEMIEFVEQPFPADLDRFPIDVRSVSRRKPLLMDESASDWKQVERGAALGWTGVALKTCKTQTGVLLSFCWARAHNLEVMVQDLTNPMLAQIPHVLLAAHAGSTKGVESNAMQFYPEASWFEAKVHPGLYARQNGQLDLSTVWGSGFGYRIDEINRPLLAPVIRCGETSRDGNVVNEPHFLVRKARVDHPRPTS